MDYIISYDIKCRMGRAKVIMLSRDKWSYKAIDGETLHSLLYMEEGLTLDFKREQYRFNKATDSDKSELLKDILAFANTQRNSTAYILVGVEEVKGERSEVVGVDDHLEDASLHQFVNGKTNRPVEFSYSTQAIEGKTVGVISIPIQQRPVWVEKRYGVVKATEVCIRDGSSTRPASPDEIAAMGRGNPARLQVKWGDATRRTVYPPDHVHRNTGLKLPDQFQTWEDRSGDYDFRALARKLGIDPAVYKDVRFSSARERAMYEPLGLCFYNNSGSVGENVRFTGTLEDRKHSRFEQLDNKPRLLFGGEHFQLEDDKKIEIAPSGDGLEIAVEVGHIRPGEYVWAGWGVRFSTKTTGTLTWKVRFVADNLPEPIEYPLPLQVEYEEREIQREDVEFPSSPPDTGWLP